MNRRNPTRIELKLDDLNEFDNAKKEAGNESTPMATTAETSTGVTTTPVINKPLTRQSIGVLRTP